MDFLVECLLRSNVLQSTDLLLAHCRHNSHHQILSFSKTILDLQEYRQHRSIKFHKIPSMSGHFYQIRNTSSNVFIKMGQLLLQYAFVSCCNAIHTIDLTGTGHLERPHGHGYPTSTMHIVHKELKCGW